MTHIWHWLLAFTGVTNGENPFATHMYNFWSGFGGGLIQFSLLGAIVAIYRHYAIRNPMIKYVKDIHPLHKLDELAVKEEERHKK
ncbi:hypothetical protein H7097_01695 [Aeromicrobium sp.]|nr:hypothetical protein [Candidatus Saccharibacteria bacterium]